MMKILLIAAGLMAAMFGALPAAAAPVSTSAPIVAAAPVAALAAPQRGEWRDRDHRRGNGWGDRRRGGWDNRRGNRWGGNRWNNRARCWNVRRYHRWVRVCGRR